MFCPYCGKPIENNFNYCPCCGESLTILKGAKPVNKNIEERTIILPTQNIINESNELNEKQIRMQNRLLNWQKQIISNLLNSLNSIFSSFIITYEKSYISFVCGNDKELPKCEAWFWFVLEDGDLVFKYKDRQNKKNTYFKYVVRDEFGDKYIFNLIKEKVEEQSKSEKNDIFQ